MVRARSRFGCRAPPPVTCGLRSTTTARWWPVRQRPGSDDEGGRGLEVIDGLIELHGGARGVVDDTTGMGKTVYVAVHLGCEPASAR
jgi:hypothetical protein